MTWKRKHMHWRVRLLISSCISNPPKDGKGWALVEAAYRWIKKDISN